MRPPTIAELRRVCEGPELQTTASVRLDLGHGDILIAFVRVLNCLELDDFDLTVAAGGSPRAELVARALYDCDGAPVDRERLVAEIERWPGWIVDQLFGAALVLNHLGERAYPTHHAGHSEAQAGEGAATPRAHLGAPPLDPLAAARERAVAELLAMREGKPRDLTPTEVAEIERILETPSQRDQRRADVTARTKGIMGTLESIGAFQRVTPGAPDA